MVHPTPGAGTDLNGIGAPGSPGQLAAVVPVG